MARPKTVSSEHHKSSPFRPLFLFVVFVVTSPRKVVLITSVSPAFQGTGGGKRGKPKRTGQEAKERSLSPNIKGEGRGLFVKMPLR